MLSALGEELHLVIEDCDYSGMIEVVARGADIEEVNAKGQTALLVAGDAIHFQLELV
jgi:hypothetical protein